MAAAEDVVGGAGTGSRHSHGPCQGEGVAVGAGVDPSPITVTILLVGMAGDLQLPAGAERGVAADVRADGLVGGAAGFGTGHRHRHQADARGCRGGIGNHLILRFRRNHDGGSAEGGAIGHRRLHFGPLVAGEGLIPTQGGVGHHLAEGGADPSGSHAAPIGHRSQGVAPLGLQGEGARGGEGAGCFGQHRAGDGGIGAVHQYSSGQGGHGGGHTHGAAVLDLVVAGGSDCEIAGGAEARAGADHPCRERVGYGLINRGGTYDQGAAAGQGCRHIDHPRPHLAIAGESLDCEVGAGFGRGGRVAGLNAEPRAVTGGD